MFRGEPGDLVFGLVSPGALLLVIPGFTGPLAVGPSLNLQPVGTLDASGELTVPLTAGALPDGIEFIARYVQPLFAATDGELILGAPTALVILDEAF